MFKCRKCSCSIIEKKLDENRKQHTAEHWLVIGFLAVILVFQVAWYVLQ